MKKLVIKNTIATLAVALLFAFTLPFFATAKNTQAQGNTSNGNANTSGGSSDTNTNSQQTTSPVQKKLGADQLKSCQNREGAINNIMARITDRAQKQLALMEQISVKVQNLYKDKNMSLGNYNALSAAVAAKKAIAEKSMNNVRAISRTFNCGSDDPKGIGTQFKSDAAVQAGALNEYKTAINNLIDGVESASASTEGTN